MPTKDDTQWKEVNLADTPTWDKKEPIEGELLSVKPNVGPHESMLYTIKTKNGDVSVWGGTVIDNKLEHVPTGVSVRIEPQGLTKSPKSGREYQDYKVFFKEAPFKEIGEKEPMPDMPEDFLQDDE